MTAGTTWAIVPVKSLPHAKRRLRPCLAAAARRRLVLTMLEDVLALLAASAAVEEILVVSPDACVLGLAGKTALVLKEDRMDGLNAAVSRGLAHARAHGASRALVLPADVPLATGEEIGRLFARGEATGPRVVLVPSADGGGTNALLLAPPDAIEPGFGRGSFSRHLARALASGAAIEVLQLPGLAADIDRPRDVARLLDGGYHADRYNFLHVARNGGAHPAAPAPQVRSR